MNLIKYHEDSALKPFGLDNMGATCYFNAMLQSLLSCTSFVEELLRNKEKYILNPVLQKLIELIELSKSNSPELSNYSVVIWKKMISFLCKKNNITRNDFMTGQQCAREGYHCLMDVMEKFNNIQNLFFHRYKNMIRCSDCNKWVSQVESMNNLFTVQPDLKPEQIEQFEKYNNEEVEMSKFLANQTGYVESFECPSCKSKNDKYNINCLVMAPEILVVLSKKYKAGQKLNVYTNFPKTLVFNGRNKTKLVYNAVSQIEHSGGLNGGHYWAISKRAGGWYNLNDTHVSSADFRPTTDTYIVFYHLFNVIS